MRAHKPISKIILDTNMRPINVTLDSQTWELAKEKTNFSEWVRNSLRSERNRSGQSDYIDDLEDEIRELERLKEYWYEAATTYRLKLKGEEE
jgi:hypothetical protein